MMADAAGGRIAASTHCFHPHGELPGRASTHLSLLRSDLINLAKPQLRRPSYRPPPPGVTSNRDQA